jgi:ubiquinone/menaquinone biosynthesis C-methylase UbiE
VAGPRVVRRMRAGDYRDIPVVDKQRYPAYYRRTFHWQTDGYFQRHSAEVYELGVELLFRGTADVMRRQIIPPITRFVRTADGAHRVRLLDVACGTGRTLHQIWRTHPTMRLWGVDLSPAYVRTARKRLANVDELAIAVENAEQLPFADATFDVASSDLPVHELPRNARRNVIAELHRVVTPGGIVVIEDSAQLAESEDRGGAPGFRASFTSNSTDYLRDDLAMILRRIRVRHRIRRVPSRRQGRRRSPALTRRSRPLCSRATTCSGARNRDHFVGSAVTQYVFCTTVLPCRTPRG